MGHLGYDGDPYPTHDDGAVMHGAPGNPTHDDVAVKHGVPGLLRDDDGGDRDAVHDDGDSQGI